MGNVTSTIEGDTLKEAIQHSEITCTLLNSNVWMTRSGNLYRDQLATVPLFYKYDMTDICAGNGYTIYCNYDTQQFYAEGDNSNGECAIPKKTKYKDKNGQYLLRCINYFRINNIKIKKVCTNITSNCTFWITDNHLIYGNGWNTYHQLGICYAANPYLPYYIESLSDLHSVIDIKSNKAESVALCRMDMNILIAAYCGNIANDSVLRDTISLYCGTTTSLYHTQEMGIDDLAHISYGSLERAKNHEYGVWMEITDLNGKEIIKIDCCNHFFLFLESNGTIWKYLICDSDRRTHYIQSYNFKLENSAKIVDITCSVDNGRECNYILMIDDEQRLYSWSDEYCEPQVIDALKDHNIEKIKCGTDHAYVMNDKNEHFLWGNNYQNECMNGKNTRCILPFCINTAIETIGIRTGKSYIKTVSPGTNCTKVIVGYPQ